MQIAFGSWNELRKAIDKGFLDLSQLEGGSVFNRSQRDACNASYDFHFINCSLVTPEVIEMNSFSFGLLSILLLVGEFFLVEGKPTVYMKNENDKLEPVLLPVSSTVIPIPIGYYQQVSAGFGVHNGKLTKHKMKLNKPKGSTKLITVSGSKKMAANESIKPH